MMVVSALCMPVFVFAYVSPGVPSGYVNDYANIISDATEAQINQELQQFEASTTIEVVVATVNSLDGDDISPFANTLFREWGIGKKDTNNGVLLLIAPNERKLRIEVGYSLEGVLTDLQSGFIIDNIITPEFKADNYDGGIMNGVAAILQVVQGEQFDVPLSDTTYNVNMEPGDLFTILVIISGVVVPWLGAIMSRSKSWWFGGILGAIVGYTLGWFFEIWEVICAILFGVIGLLFDRAVSSSYDKHVTSGTKIPWYAGGSSGGFGRSSSSGGFGGFGGGSSGGGGASGSW